MTGAEIYSVVYCYRGNTTASEEEGSQEEETILDNFFHYNEGLGVPVWERFGQSAYCKIYYDKRGAEVQKVYL
jgi:hypothetical protein